MLPGSQLGQPAQFAGSLLKPDSPGHGVLECWQHQLNRLQPGLITRVWSPFI